MRWAFRAYCRVAACCFPRQSFAGGLIGRSFNIPAERTLLKSLGVPGMRMPVFRGGAYGNRICHQSLGCLRARLGDAIAVAAMGVPARAGGGRRATRRSPDAAFAATPAGPARADGGAGGLRL